MSIDKKLVHCEPDDPHRCQASQRNGQCPFRAMEGFKYCARHGGRLPGMKEKQEVKQYRLQVWQQRLDEFTESDKVKSLRDEIGILRIIMENILNQCHDSGDLLRYSSKISELAAKIEKLVVSCNRLERSMGMMLDKTAALNLASQIVEIIGAHVNDPEVIDAISGEIITALAAIQ